MGKMTSVVIDREIGDGTASAIGADRQLTPASAGRVQQRQDPTASCVTKHGNQGSELRWWNWLRAGRFQPNYHAVRKWRQILLKALARSRAQKSDRGRGAPVGVDLWRIKTGRSAPKSRINQLMSSREQKRWQPHWR